MALNEEGGDVLSQLRLDPLTGRWVVVSVDRARRPEAFRPPSQPEAAGTGHACPFCPGHEEATPPALESDGPGGDWRVRVVANLYPAFAGADPMVVTHKGPVFTEAPASGIHEVLVLSPDHSASWADLEGDQVELVMRAIKERLAAHASTPGLRYGQAIVNLGREAGASLDHPHAQLLSMPFVPREITEEQAGFARFAGNCLLCTTLESESRVHHRVVEASNGALSLCPFWSGVPFEMLVAPKAHGAHLHLASEEELVGVGMALRTSLRSLRERLGAVAYNLVFHSAPYRAAGTFHWHVHVLPKLTTLAGFELGTGVLINIVSPEEAAEQLTNVGAGAG
jgi:UDPglucose--hexose-1-phosphate uridylyltransferase